MFEMPFGAGLRTDGNHDHEQPIGPDDPAPPFAVNAELVVQTSDFYQALPGGSTASFDVIAHARQSDGDLSLVWRNN